MGDPPTEQVEKLLTIRQAADELGLPYWKVNRAVQAGLVPSYSLFNTRKLVRISELLQAIKNQKEPNHEK